MKKLIALFLLFFTGLTLADLPTNPRFTWVNPTLNTDGTVLTDLAATYIKCPAHSINPIVVAAPATSYTSIIGEFIDGQYDCNVTSVNVGGVESSPVPLVRFTVQAAPTPTTPMPPTQQTVN